MVNIFLKNWLSTRVRRSRDELISNVLLWTPSHGLAKSGRPARTYILQLCEDTRCSPEDLPEAMNNREEWRERLQGYLCWRHDMMMMMTTRKRLVDKFSFKGECFVSLHSKMYHKSFIYIYIYIYIRLKFAIIVSDSIPIFSTQKDLLNILVDP